MIVSSCRVFILGQFSGLNNFLFICQMLLIRSSECTSLAYHWVVYGEISEVFILVGAIKCQRKVFRLPFPSFSVLADSCRGRFILELVVKTCTNQFMRCTFLDHRVGLEVATSLCVFTRRHLKKMLLVRSGLRRTWGAWYASAVCDKDDLHVLVVGTSHLQSRCRAIGSLSGDRCFI